MNNSSAQDTYSITLDDTLNSSFGTITIPNSGTSYTYTNSYPTISVGSGATISTISSISAYDTFKISLPEEWVDTFPDWERVEKMCNEYPGLKIAFDKFKTVYKLVKDDYDTPKDKRAKP
jgi:hypothetical protein